MDSFCYRRMEIGRVTVMFVRLFGLLIATELIAHRIVWVINLGYMLIYVR